MKIAKIIDIMKSFTSFPLSVKTGDNPALQVIIPTLWGASPHLLGEEFGVAGPCRMSLGPVLARRSTVGAVRHPSTEDK